MASQSKRPILWKRFYTYIQAVYAKDPERWVTRNSLFDLALGHHYTKNEAWDAIYKLDNHTQMARITENGVTQYRYLNLSHQEAKKLQKMLNDFDKMP